jgi:poly [ADP-ribose] polymerase
MIPAREPDQTRKFQCTMLGENSNKWYQLEWWKSEAVVRITFARVGQSCAKPAIKLGISERKFDKLIADRLKKRTDGTQYFEIKLGTEVLNVITPMEDTKVTRRILQIFKAANEDISKYLSVNVSDLSLEQLQLGKTYLDDVAGFYTKYKATSDKKVLHELISATEKYYNSIPTKLPHKINPEQVSVTLGASLSEQEDRIQQLMAAVTGYKSLETGASITEQLGSSLTEVDDTKFAELSKFVLDTRKHSGYSSLKIKEIYEVVIADERQAYESNKVGNPKMLFHGSASKNFRHILRTGLIIPSYAANGSMYGRGAYFADVSTKSLNYCSSNSYNDTERYLLLADVKLGNMYHTTSTLSWNSIPSSHKQYDSVFAGSLKPMSGSYGGSLMFNEYIVYNTSQQTIKYLVVVEV